MNRLSALNRLGCRVVRSQAGAVLIVSLVLLLVLTILGVSGVQNTAMEERMAGNYRDRFSAFQAAEAALRIGERAVGVYSTFSGMGFDGTKGTFDSDKLTGSADPTDPDNYINVSTATISGVASTPEYFVERVPKVPLANSSLVVGFQGKTKDVQYYRITGKGTGSGGRAEVILQSTFHR